MENSFAPNAETRPIGASASELQSYDGIAVYEACQHSDVREIGEDIDQNGNPLTLVRYEQCDLLICEYLETDQRANFSSGA